MKTFLLTLSIFMVGCLSSTTLLSQRSLDKRITDIQFHYPEGTDLLKTNVLFPVFSATFADGQQRSTKAILNKKLSLRKFNIHVDNAKWHPLERKLVFDLHEVYKNGGEIIVSVQVKKQPHQIYRFVIDFPTPQAIIARYDDSAYLTPGHPIPIALDIELSDGRWISTRTGDFHTDQFWRFMRTETNAVFTNNHSLLLTPEAYKEHTHLWFQAIYRGDSSIRSQILDIPLAFNGPQLFYFGGAMGAEGELSGWDGYPGQHGEDINVFVQSIHIDGKHFLKVSARSKSKEFQTMINPDLGSLEINCQGGRGGEGRDGSDGCDGREASGETAATAGEAGEDGGDGGDGGNGGNVFFYTDIDTRPFIYLIQVNNLGGAKGEGGGGGYGGDGGGDKPDGCDGSDGNDGRAGRNGNTPEIQIISEVSLDTFFRKSD